MSKETTTTSVIDFNEVRQQKLEEKRRKNERVLIKNLLGIYTVTEGSRMRPLEILDLSEDGCAFQVPFEASQPWPTENELTVRFYFNQDMYIPVKLTIINSNAVIADGMRFVRYGCSVDVNTATYETYQNFVRFVKSVSENAYKDQGGMQVFYL